ncbi:MAG TPA: Wzz/FepE/Etk N-terminal domain-containing protein [Thermoleophilia bacterium]|nr:Wzz/FepE/Etk N-terminal domain-containing protein [Thermoleophilia bacterium]
MALQDYVDVLRRRRWIILAAVVLVPLLAVSYSLQQTPVYEASAKVLLSQQSVANSLTGISDPNASVQDLIRVQTQADVARAPEIAEGVVAAVDGLESSPEQFLADSSVAVVEDTEILEFTASNTDPDLAVAGTAEYANQYTKYRQKLDTASPGAARRAVSRRLEELAAAGESEGALYSSLVKREQELRTLQTLQTSNAKVIDTPDGASQVSPQPVRAGVIGLLLGAVLGVGLAFVREALDTRVHGGDELGARLDLPLLARIPEPPKQLRDEGRLATVAEPGGSDAEAFRMLRTNVEFSMVNLNDVRSIMITSAVAEEGKSTTVANLALAFARAGRHVVLIDLDLRRPRISRFFRELGGKPGITDVIVHRAELEDAKVRVPILPSAPGQPSMQLNGREMSTIHENGGGGRLEVIASGPVPPDPGELVTSHALSQLLERLHEGGDLILIDSPPMLQVGDAMALSARVDAVAIVARIKLLRRRTVGELHRLLGTTPAHKLGFILTDAQTEHGYGYGYGDRYAPPPHKEETPEVHREETLESEKRLWERASWEEGIRARPQEHGPSPVE